MFKETDHNRQLDMFNDPSLHMCKRAYRIYSDPKAWHNMFYALITSKVDESVFKVLFNDSIGAPNGAICIIVGMMIYKAGCGCSDAELESRIDFDLQLRRALGLFEISDAAPSLDTYYMFRRRLVEYQKETGTDLMAKCFAQLTSLQIAKFNISGKSVRMDSKLIGSNIAWYSRYQIIHETFLKCIDKEMANSFTPQLKEKVLALLHENAKNVVYTSDQETINSKLRNIGLVISGIMAERDITDTLLYRVFNEQFEVVNKKDDEGNDTDESELLPRDKHSISASSVQNPNDPEADYRKKSGQKVKGYSTNITETTDEEGKPSLITSVQVQPATAADNSYVTEAITSTETITGNKVQTLYTDGAYGSEANRAFAEEHEMNFITTGVQGKPARFGFELKDDGLLVTDKSTGDIIQAEKRKDKWRIRVGGKVPLRYFSEEYVQRMIERKRQIPQEELNKRNNVEATIFQYCFHTRNNKTRYRGLAKHRMHSYARCMWINLVRLTIFQITILQRPVFALRGFIGGLFDFWSQNLVSNFRQESKILYYWLNWHMDPKFAYVSQKCRF